MGFSKQESWNRLPFPTPGNLLDPGIELVSLVSPALAGGFFTTSATRPGKPNVVCTAPLKHFKILINFSLLPSVKHFKDALVQGSPTSEI